MPLIFTRLVYHKPIEKGLDLVKANKKMKSFLNKAKKQTNLKIKEYSELLWPNFIEENGCVFFEREYQKSGKIDYDRYFDKIGAEAFVNHIHLNDYIDDHLNNFEKLFIGTILLDVWSCKIKMEYPSYRFVFILSFDDDGECILRFHKERKGSSWIDMSKIEDYSEGIIVKEI